MNNYLADSLSARNPKYPKFLLKDLGIFVSGFSSQPPLVCTIPMQPHTRSQSHHHQATGPATTSPSPAPNAQAAHPDGHRAALLRNFIAQTPSKLSLHSFMRSTNNLQGSTRSITTQGHPFSDPGKAAPTVLPDSHLPPLL